MLKIDVATTLFCCPVSRIEIPEIDSWSQIEAWFVKWDTFHYTLDGENYKEIDLNNSESIIDCLDFKRPVSTRITNTETDELLEDEDD